MGKRKSFPFVPILIFGAALSYASYNLIHVITPFALSAAFAYIVNPLITHFEIRGLRRYPVVVALYISFGLILTLTVTKLLPIISFEWSQMQALAPAYLAHTQKFLGTLPARLAQNLPLGGRQVEEWSKTLYDPLINQLQYIPNYLLGLFPLLSLLFLVPFITFFFLLDSKRSISGMIQSCPSRYVEQALYLMSEIDTSLGNYLRGIMLEAMAVAAASYVGLLLLGLDHALAIAALTGLSSFVPYLGAVIGATVGGCAALLQFGTFAAAVKVVLLFAGIRFVDDWLLQPLISKHSVHLHPLFFLLSLMVGGELLGFIGLVFAIPAACIIKSLVKVAWDWYTSESRRDDFKHVATGLVPYT